jgi:hypothetical protein
MPFNSASLLGLGDTVFDRVVVDHLSASGTRVSWQLRFDFPDPGPYDFTLQVGESGISAADDWADIGTITDGFTLTDSEARDISVTPTTHYRVKLVTDAATYYSKPEPSWGTMHRRDWLRACAVARREMLRLRLAASEPGWLFKRRKKTPVVTDTRVVDFLTGEVRVTKNTASIGTDRIGGYFTPVPHYIDLDPAERYAHRDPERGNVDDVKTIGRCLGYPQLDHGDVWASATGDARFQIHRVRVVTAFRNVPVVVSVEACRLSPTDPVYELVLPDPPMLQTLNRAEL